MRVLFPEIQTVLKPDIRAVFGHITIFPDCIQSSVCFDPLITQIAVSHGSHGTHTLFVCPNV